MFLPLYVIRFKIGPLPTTVLEIFILISFIGWFIYKISHKSLVDYAKSSIKCRWFWPILVWLIVTLIAVFISPDRFGAFGYWRAFMLEPILVFMMLASLIPLTALNKEGVERKMLMFGIAVVTILLGIYAIVQYLTGWGIPSPWDAWPGRRATGVFGFPNGLSLFMAPFGIACFIEWLIPPAPLNKGGVIARWSFFSATILAVVAEILAQSMGGILALGIGIVLALLIKKNTRKIGLVVTAIGLIAAGLVGYKILSTQLRSTDLNASLALNKKWSSMVRTVIWSESWELIKAHPLTGTGLRSYQTAIIPFHKATWMEIYPHPHNIILMLWIETGPLGLLAFIWLCVAWVLAVKKNKNWIWIVPLIVILVHGMVDMPYFKNDLAMQFWILAALATL
jgi:O-antigen ligase